MMLMIQLLLKSYPILINLDFTPKPILIGTQKDSFLMATNYLYFRKTGQNKVDVYSKTKNCNYNAILESSYNANGLITGAETSANEKVIYLTGYSSSAAPFYIYYTI
jgi:hypothetical protein